MPRTPLGPISGNRTYKQELTPAKRGQIVGRFLEGATATSIARDENLPRSTVRSTLQSTPLRKNQESNPRSGRPARITKREERAILRAIQAEPDITYKTLKRDLGLTYSRSTIYRCIKRLRCEHDR